MFHQCQEEIPKNIYSSLLQLLNHIWFYRLTCFKERTRSHVTTKFHSSSVHFQSIDWSWEKLPELGVRVFKLQSWGMEKFHYFLYSKEFTLETDQKPLVVIYKKHMVEISPRIQCLVVQRFPYQPFDVQYWRGVEIPLANALSRVTPLPMEEDGIQLPIIAVNQITANIPCSSNNLDQIHEESRKDPTLKLLMQYISNGWPHERKQLPQELHTYWNYQEDMSIKDGIATKGHRILIPSTIQRKALQQIHKGHQGVEKCMLKAQEPVFWPEYKWWYSAKLWNRCNTCQLSSRTAKTLGSANKVPPHPWHTLGTDLFYWNKINFLMWSMTISPNSSLYEDFWTVPHMSWSKNSEWSLLNLANHLCWEATMDLAKVPRSSRSSLSSIKCTIPSWAAHIIHGAMVLPRLLCALPRSWWKKPSKIGNHGTTDCYNIELLQFPVTSHHH